MKHTVKKLLSSASALMFIINPAYSAERYLSIVDGVSLVNDSIYTTRSTNLNYFQHDTELNTGSVSEFSTDIEVTHNIQKEKKTTHRYQKENALGYVSIFGGISLTDDLVSDFTYMFNTGYVGSAYQSDTELETGFIVGLTAGTNITDNVRIEAELSYQREKAKENTYFNPVSGFTDHYAVSGNIKSYNILTNLWYDFENSTGLTPYIGGGLGASFVNADIEYENFTVGVLKNNRWAFTYQVGGGLNWKISDFTSLDLSYRYKETPSVDFTQPFTFGTVDNGNVDLRSHNITAGITWKLYD